MVPMFRRLITAVILAGPLVLAVLFLPRPWVAGLFALFVLMAGWEWAGLCGLRTGVARATYVLLLALLLICSYLFREGSLPLLLDLLAVAWWLTAMVLVLVHERKPLRSSPPVPVGLVAGLLVLVPSWFALVWLQALSPGLTLWLLVVIWAADSLAYFSGRRWGRHRLAPRVSPGKTVEGLAGGVLGSLGLALSLLLLTPEPPLPLPLLMTGCLLAVLFSVLGDLLESLCKRLAGIKDSGNLLPGHGGVLDRIDSLTAATPVFTFTLMINGVTP